MNHTPTCIGSHILHLPNSFIHQSNAGFWLLHQAMALRFVMEQGLLNTPRLHQLINNI